MYMFLKNSKSETDRYVNAGMDPGFSREWSEIILKQRNLIKSSHEIEVIQARYNTHISMLVSRRICPHIHDLSKSIYDEIEHLHVD